MRIIIDVESFFLDDYERDGRRHNYARLKGRTSEGEVVPALVWNADAVNMDRALKNLTPDGLDLRDVNLAIQLEGNYRTRTRKSGSRTFPERSFYVDEGGYQILTGPAAELRTQRVRGAEAYQAAATLAETGDHKAAFERLSAFVRSFARVDVEPSLAVPFSPSVPAAIDATGSTPEDGVSGVALPAPEVTSEHDQAQEPDSSLPEPSAATEALDGSGSTVTEPSVETVEETGEVSPVEESAAEAVIEVPVVEKQEPAASPEPEPATVVAAVPEPAAAVPEIAVAEVAPQVFVSPVAAEKAAEGAPAPMAVRRRRGSMMSVIESGEPLLNDESPEELAAREFGISQDAQATQEATVETAAAPQPAPEQPKPSVPAAAVTPTQPRSAAPNAGVAGNAPRVPTTPSRGGMMSRPMPGRPASQPSPAQAPAAQPSGNGSGGRAPSAEQPAATPRIGPGVRGNAPMVAAPATPVAPTTPAAPAYRPSGTPRLPMSRPGGGLMRPGAIPAHRVVAQPAPTPTAEPTPTGVGFRRR